MVRNFANKKIFSLFALSLLLMARTVHAGEDRERAELLRLQKQERHRIEKLRREQDYLLFEKIMYESDSKYLILNIRSGKGEFKYKNRLLREFRILGVGSHPGRFKSGQITLTDKIEAKKRRDAMVFGNDLVLRRYGDPPKSDGSTPKLFLPKKDFMAIFYAVENGARAYVLP